MIKFYRQPLAWKYFSKIRVQRSPQCTSALRFLLPPRGHMHYWPILRRNGRPWRVSLEIAGELGKNKIGGYVGGLSLSSPTCLKRLRYCISTLRVSAQECHSPSKTVSQWQPFQATIRGCYCYWLGICKLVSRYQGLLVVFYLLWLVWRLAREGRKGSNMSSSSCIDEIGRARLGRVVLCAALDTDTTCKCVLSWVCEIIC